MSDMTTDTAGRVTVTLTGAVADVRMNRPDKRNALDPAMFEALVTAGERLKAQPGLRAVVLSGEGPDFCAGLDFASFQAMRAGERLSAAAQLPPSGGPAKSTGQRAAYVWAEIPVPVIAALRGNALGGGLQIALGADIRIVTPDARLSVLEVAWGLIPDMTGTQLLPELVGRDVAKELTYTARIISGEAAARPRRADRPGVRVRGRAGGDPRADRKPQPGGGRHSALRKARPGLRRDLTARDTATGPRLVAEQRSVTA
jgi:enoyl-CoA hydratase/carnithine racemase